MEFFTFYQQKLYWYAIDFFFFLHRRNSNCILLVNEVISKYKVYVGSGIFEAEKTRCKIRILEDSIKDEFPK